LFKKYGGKFYDSPKGQHIKYNDFSIVFKLSIVEGLVLFTTLVL